MKMNLVEDLQGAVSRGEIVALYQPQVDLRSLRVVAVEALARWNHPDFGLVAPSIFIPLAEMHDLIDEIGAFMIDDGTRRAAEWRDVGLDLEVAINVSAAQLTKPDVLDHVQSRLETLALEPSRIVIEITESLPIVDAADATARLTELRRLGLNVSIDDFGAGYSAAARLVEIPATEIKIEKTLIQDAGESEALLRAVVEDAHAQALRVVAEGIETEAHLALARQIGCDRGQGYLFGRPMLAEKITELLTA